jgi:hypothetical protein
VLAIYAIKILGVPGATASSRVSRLRQPVAGLSYFGGRGGGGGGGGQMKLAQMGKRESAAGQISSASLIRAAKLLKGGKSARG